MATEKQIAANRRNAQLSTGPKTPEGKAAVRFNGLKHGFYAKQANLSLDEDEPIHELLDTFLDNLEPPGPLEAGLFEMCLAHVFRDKAAIRRYEAHIKRSIYRDLRELQRLLAARVNRDFTKRTD
jgi:hypothetical protein